ncbi:hypothetical protein GCM10010199_30460 [Dactylosporangium roseum]
MTPPACETTGGVYGAAQNGPVPSRPGSGGAWLELAAGEEPLAWPAESGSRRQRRSSRPIVSKWWVIGKLSNARTPVRS